ncbi:hypothetical protein GCM10010214_07290 [Streptomyces abikoensis]|nr:hypothetical protein GCM10010214_07290 [Streptomyces abikoensis]
MTRATTAIPYRRELRKRRILPVISRKGAPNIEELGKLRYVVEQAFSLLHPFKRLATRGKRRLDMHDALAFPGLRPHLLETTQEGPCVIALRALMVR